MKATVNKIIPFSSVDGPGNRTAIFLQGCNMNCLYCHNPETRSKCVHCGVCVSSCPTGALSFKNKRVLYDPAKCIQCDTCIKVCPYGSSPKTADMTPMEVWQVVEKQVPFIRGITVSGGECTLYPEFLTELFKLAQKNGLSTLIDSNGTLDFEHYPDLLAVTDGVMLDIKAFDPFEHKKVTGMDNAIVLKNARFLASKGKLFEVRTVVSPGLFDAEQTITQTAEMLKPYLSLSPIRYKLIAYRPMGVRAQYAKTLQIPTQNELEYYAGLLKAKGFNDITII
ncbi:MAG: YjjW family glycine radical enzyme activase [Acutalibacteraceae bacterium]|jgi:pyruvate formate lyase activating enzyme